MSRQIRGRPGTLFVLNRSFVEEVRHVGVRDATIATGWSVAALMTALLISSHKSEWMMEAGS